MKRPSVVCLGVHLLDVLVRPVPTQRLAAGVIQVDEVRLTAAGTAAGTAVDLAKLGVDTIAMGAVGEDALGDVVLALMGSTGVDVSRLVRRSTGPTRSSVLLVGPDGERHTCLFHPGVAGELTETDVDFAAIAGADVLHVGGADVLGDFSREPLGEIMAFARKQGVTTTLDVLSSSCSPATVEALAPVLGYTQYFFPNEHQLAAMSGLGDCAAGAAFFRKLGVECVAVTLGDAGSLVVTSEAVTKIPPLQVDVVDTTGCGDAYAAGFIVGVTHGWDTTSAGWLGSASSALVASGLGSDAGITSLEETLAFLAERAPAAVADLARSFGRAAARSDMQAPRGR